MSPRQIGLIAGGSSLLVALVLIVVGLTGDSVFLIVGIAVAVLGVAEMLVLPALLASGRARTRGPHVKRR